jgi:hypothetical protein
VDPGAPPHIWHVVRFFSHRASGARSLAAGLYPFCLLLGFLVLSPILSAAFPAEGDSYRAFRFPWTGGPQDVPTVTAGPGAEGEVTLYASWNGATEVATWEVLAGPGPTDWSLSQPLPARASRRRSR